MVGGPLYPLAQASPWATGFHLAFSVFLSNQTTWWQSKMADKKQEPNRAGFLFLKPTEFSCAPGNL